MGYGGGDNGEKIVVKLGLLRLHHWRGVVASREASSPMVFTFFSCFAIDRPRLLLLFSCDDGST